jgi:Zn-dependent peptidase ImmA (M78 family)
VREFATTNGPFPTQPFYEDEEIEHICEDELARNLLLPSEPSPVRIDRFIEKRFGITPTTRDLPPGVLGYTTFSNSGVKEIVIATAVDNDEDSTTRRRARTTFAHEASHGLLHAHLFASAFVQQRLVRASTDTPQVLCRDEPLGPRRAGYDGRWWEVQANKGMAALLLPRQLVHKAIAPFVKKEGMLGLTILPEAERETAARQLSDIFDVNPVVARYRLTALIPTTNQAVL